MLRCSSAGYGFKDIPMTEALADVLLCTVNKLFQKTLVLGSKYNFEQAQNTGVILDCLSAFSD